MKYIGILTCSLLLLLTRGYSQKDQPSVQQHDLKRDSLVTDRMLTKMKSLFEVTGDQERAIQQAVVKMNQDSKQLFTEYRRSEDFQRKIADGERNKDALYQSIIGEKNYALYKEAVQKEREQKAAAMAERMRAKFGTVDTTTTKPEQP